MIDLTDVSFCYDKRGPRPASAFAMQVASFAVPQGCSTALVGPSGSGKTTLLSLIAGTLRVDSGRICVNETVVSDLGEGELGRYRIRNVGQVFQSFELFNYLNVIENVMLPWYILPDGDKAETYDRAVGLLTSVSLGSKLRSRPDKLSQGEQQRVAVCRAMLNNPPILLADEPTGNLDQDNKQKVVDLLIEQAGQDNRTLLMVTHDESLLGKFDLVLDIHGVAQPLDQVTGI